MLMLTVVKLTSLMLSVTIKPIVLSVIMQIVVRLNVVAPKIKLPGQILGNVFALIYRAP
jgi:hypothetical protein